MHYIQRTDLLLLFCHFSSAIFILFHSQSIRFELLCGTHTLTSFIYAFWPPPSLAGYLLHIPWFRMFWFSLAFSWKRWCCCWLLWLPFETIETCVNRILTSIMLISNRARKANGYLILQWVRMHGIYSSMYVCVCVNLGFLFCFHAH